MNAATIGILIAGIALLVAGRRLYWLMVGLVGFLLGIYLTLEYLDGPFWLVGVVGLIAGLGAAGLAVLFQKLVVTVAGFFIGGMSVLWWAGNLGWGDAWWVWALAAAAAVAGAWLVLTVFEVGLIILSSILGASFVLDELPRPANELSPVFLVLVGAGILVQFMSLRASKRE